MPFQGGVKAGRISKPNGLQGKVNIILDPDTGKSIETKNPLFIDIDGQRVPFFIEEYTVVSNDQAILQLEFIDSIEEARTICGCDAYLDSRVHLENPVESNDLKAVTGFKAYDQNTGYLGGVIEYVKNDLNPVLVIDYRGKEMMVPAAEEFIIRIDYREQSIHFNLPEGLTEL